jgi:hypothetical protein
VNSRSTRLLAFVFLLLAIVLISAITVVVLWAKPDNPNKPNNTGKPEESLPDYVVADYKIWIGTGNLASPEDVILQPFGDPVIDYLFIDDENCGLWLPRPPKKGNKPVEGGWDVYLGNVNIGPSEEPEYCGTYQINNQGLLNKLNDVGIYPEDVDVIIGHYEGDLRTVDNPDPIDADFWHIRIGWVVDNTLYTLNGETERGPEPEGEFDEITDTWTVTFDTSYELLEWTGEVNPETGNIETKIWEGQLSFTVEIQRILP